MLTGDVIQVITAYLLIIASFLIAMMALIAPTKSLRTALMLVWMVLLCGHSWIVSFPTALEGLLFVSLVPAAIVAYFIKRRRLTPPCVAENVSYRAASAFVVILLVIFFSISSLVGSGHISLVLMIASTVFFIFTFCLPSAICRNGVWDRGELHLWEEYDSYSLTKKENCVVIELKQKAKFREPVGSCFVQLIVPPENWEAAKQLLEANLPNLSVEPEA